MRHHWRRAIRKLGEAPEPRSYQRVAAAWGYRGLGRFDEARSVIPLIDAKDRALQLDYVHIDERGVVGAHNTIVDPDYRLLARWVAQWPAQGRPASFARFVARSQGRDVLTRWRAHRLFIKFGKGAHQLTSKTPGLYAGMADLLTRRGEKPLGVEIMTAAILYRLASDALESSPPRDAFDALSNTIGGYRYPGEELTRLVTEELTYLREREARHAARRIAGDVSRRVCGLTGSASCSP